MRNIFDQYSQPENRLTHALVCCLSEDRRLLRQFIRWTTGASVNRSDALDILEQRLPGELVLTEEEAERRGLPDACIHDNENWCLLIESKVAASLQNDQLRRHRRTALKRGFEDITVLAVDVAPPRHELPEGVIFREWSEIYQWFVERSDSVWARRMSEYLEVAETKLSEDGYLKEGTLTVFSGIPFSDRQPYSYPEAKRVLKLAMGELRARKDLINDLRMNPICPGRGAITGKQGLGVWDYLRLAGSDCSEPFNKYPHMTLSIQHNRVLTMLMIPHGIKTEYRRNLVNLGYEEFSDVLNKVNRNMFKLIDRVPGSSPWVHMLQRRYPSINSKPTIDAKIEFDLRTAFPDKKRHSVKTQPQWLQSTYEALVSKRSNLEVGVGAVFPYQECEAVKSKKILDHIAKAWISTKPILDVMHNRAR